MPLANDVASLPAGACQFFGCELDALPEHGHELIDLGSVDHERRRTSRHHAGVDQRTHEKAEALTVPIDQAADLIVLAENGVVGPHAAKRALIGGHQPDTTNLGNKRQVEKLAKSLLKILKIRTDVTDVLQEAVALHEAQVGQRGDANNRMSRIGEAVGEDHTLGIGVGAEFGK